MSQERWKPLLEHISEEEMLVVAQSISSSDDKVGEIAEELGWEPVEVVTTLQYLDQAGLIDSSVPEYRVIDVPEKYKKPGPYLITQKGFEVAREIRRNNRRDGHNQFIALLTLSIAVSSILMSIPDDFSRYQATSVGLLSVQIILFLLVCILLWRQDLLKF